MKNLNQRQGKKPTHIKVQMMMLEKGINRKIIMDQLAISASLLSKALSGKRVAALERVAEFVRAYKKSITAGSGDEYEGR